MNHIVFVAFLFFTIGLLVSCANEIPTVIPEKEEEIVRTYQMLITADTAIYSMKIAYQLEDNSDDYQKENITKIILKYPLIDSFRTSSIVDSVNNIILKTILSDAVGLKTPTIEAYTKMFVADYKEYNKEMKEFGIGFSSSWFYELDINVLLNAPNLISMQVNKLEFTGGAHANPWTNYLNIDLKTGKIISLEELLVGDYQSQLLVSAEAAFRKTVNLELNTNLSETQYEFSSGTFELPEHFSIGQKGFSFYFNHYDLGPYSLGAMSFDVPYDDLLEILNKDRLYLEGIKVK